MQVHGRTAHGKDVLFDLDGRGCSWIVSIAISQPVLNSDGVIRSQSSVRLLQVLSYVINQKTSLRGIPEPNLKLMLYDHHTLSQTEIQKQWCTRYS